MFPEVLPDRYQSNATFLDKTQSLNLWSNIVRQFSECNLTFENDKLPAISGIAKWMASQVNDEYLAGLWRRDLESQLLWYSSKHLQDSPHLWRTYRAPSWSWASVDGAAAAAQIPITSQSNLRIRVIQAEVSTVTSDSFGEVSWGIMRISCGRILRGAFMFGGFQLGNGMSISISVYPTGAVEKEMPVCLLSIFDGPGDGWSGNSRRKIEELILRPTGFKKGQFYRIGDFSVHHRGGYDQQYREAETMPNTGISESEYEEGDRQYVIKIV